MIADFVPALPWRVRVNNSAMACMYICCIMRKRGIMLKTRRNNTLYHYHRSDPWPQITWTVYESRQIDRQIYGHEA